jgi:hypothetical protein
MERDIPSHIRDAVLSTKTVDWNMRLLIAEYFKQALAGDWPARRIPSDALRRFEELAGIVVNNTISWKNEKKQREKSRSELSKFFAPLVRELPIGSASSAIDAIFPAAVLCVVEIAYQAILGRAGREFAVAAVFTATTCLTTFPQWLSEQIASGNVTWTAPEQA